MPPVGGNCQAQMRLSQIDRDTNPSDELQAKLKLGLPMPQGRRLCYQLMGAVGIVAFVLPVAESARMDHVKGKLCAGVVVVGKRLKMQDGGIEIAPFQRCKASIQHLIPVTCYVMGWCR